MRWHRNCLTRHCHSMTQWNGTTRSGGPWFTTRPECAATAYAPTARAAGAAVASTPTSLALTATGADCEARPRSSQVRDVRPHRYAPIRAHAAADTQRMALHRPRRMPPACARHRGGACGAWGGVPVIAPCPGSRAIPSIISSDFTRCWCDMCGRIYATNFDGTVRAHPYDYARFVDHMACVVGQVTTPWQFGSAIR